MELNPIKRSGNPLHDRSAIPSKNRHRLYWLPTSEQYSPGDSKTTDTIPALPEDLLDAFPYQRRYV